MLAQRMGTDRLGILLMIAWLVGGTGVGRARQVLPPEPADESGKSKLAQRINQVLSDPTEMEKLEKERARPPLEVSKTTILPNDVLPYVKANQWVTMSVAMRANHGTYSGLLQTAGVPLRDMPHEVSFRREVGLVKGQTTTLRLQMMLPSVPKAKDFLLLRLLRPESLRDDITYRATLFALEPHQMLIPVLMNGPSDAYGKWNQLRTVYPLSGTKSDQTVYDRQRYFRMVVPSEPGPPLLPTHPLAWTSISHVIWDGLPPDALSISQQEAMLDWLHWGGQLILVGGAAPNFAALGESFLSPYLPAEPSGQNAQLGSDDLTGFARAYPPLAAPHEADDPIEATQDYASAFGEVGRRYRDPAPIPLVGGKPLFVKALTPKPGARAIGFDKAGLPPIGVEWRVGRGRVLMLGVSIVDPSLMAWGGYETLIRRVVLRRPEEVRGEELRYATSQGGYLPPRYDFLTGPDLTWTRIFGRDLGAPTRKRLGPDDDEPATPTSTLSSPIARTATRSTGPTDSASLSNPWQVPVAEWLDSSALPKLSREALERASGIEIPGRRFVMGVILAYLVAIVPLNWIVCRYALGRREWAWVFVPILSIGFAILVERAAAYDVGYDSACTEIDLIESHGDYPRAHLSRFASLYTTGRVKFEISYPNDPAALALPMATGRAIRGEDIQQSVFQATPIPMLTDFRVQPRSLAMFRAEGFVNLPGSISVKGEGTDLTVVNGSEVELKDAVLVAIGDRESRATRLGTIGPKGEVAVPADSIPVEKFEPTPLEGLKKDDVDPGPFLSLMVRSSIAARPEDFGELRLIARTDKPQAGQTLDPPVDLHQGFTLVVAHLRLGPTPDPASARYNILASGPERPSPEKLNETPPPQVNTRQRAMMGLPNPTPPRRRLAPIPAGAISTPETEVIDAPPPDSTPERSPAPPGSSGDVPAVPKATEAPPR